MTRLHEVIEVPRPLDEVFRYTSNFANIEQWDPGVSESSGLSKGPVGQGSEFMVTVKFGPAKTPMKYRITHFEPPHRVVLEGIADSVHAIDEICFEATATGTRIDYKADISLKRFGGALEPLMGGVLDRVGKKALAGLKKALSHQPDVPTESFSRDLLDRMILPGALSFTRLGYAHKRKSWSPLLADLSGQVAVITGANSGLGRIAAEQLAGFGARVILVGRRQEALQKAVDEISLATGSEALSMMVADLGLMSEVRSLADRLLENEESIHILVNNAAVLPLARTLTSEGLETAFATDLLSPYLLTELLLPRLEASSPARIINVLSGGMYLARFKLDDLQFEQGKYDGSRAYARAKRGLMMMTKLWAAQLQESGVVVNAMHPGWADTPGVRNSMPAFHRQMKKVLRSPEEGADTIVWLAAAPEAGKVSGKFWLDREPHLDAIIPGTGNDPAQNSKLREALENLARR